MLDIGLIGHILRPHDHQFHFSHKFGRNPSVDTAEEDIWNVGGKETLVPTGVTMYASCEDNVNGVGQVIQVFGLDENWGLVSGIVTLTGNTQAPITKADGSALLLTRISRAYQISAEPDPVGDVWFAESDTVTLGVPQTATKIHGWIEYTNAAQQTEKCMITVPANHIAFITSFSTEMLQSGGAARQASVFIEVQDLAYDSSPTASPPTWAPWRRVHQHAISTSSIAEGQSFDVPIRCDELTNIHVRATATAASEIIADMHIAFTKKDDL